MNFLIQFVRFRRGVPEVIHTVPLSAPDPETVQATVEGFSGTARWPSWTEAIRVLDDGGRTMRQWRPQKRTIGPTDLSGQAGAI